MEGYNTSEGSETPSVMKTTSRTSRKKRQMPSERCYFNRFMGSQVEQSLKVDKGFKPQMIHGTI